MFFRALNFQKTQSGSTVSSPPDSKSSISNSHSGSPSPSGAPEKSIPVGDLVRFADEWHLDCAYRLHSEKTIRPLS